MSSKETASFRGALYGSEVLPSAQTCLATAAFAENVGAASIAGIICRYGCGDLARLGERVKWRNRLHCSQGNSWGGPSLTWLRYHCVSPSS